jgi:hypothetical protein
VPSKNHTEPVRKTIWAPADVRGQSIYQLIAVVGTYQILTSGVWFERQDEAARLAFPAGGVDGKTLGRQVRKGTLRAYRIGKVYHTTLRDVKAWIVASAVQTKVPRPYSAVPNGLGLTEVQIAEMSARHMLEKLKQSLPKRRR